MIIRLMSASMSIYFLVNRQILKLFNKQLPNTLAMRFTFHFTMNEPTVHVWKLQQLCQLHMQKICIILIYA